MTIQASVKLADDAKIQYFRTLVRVKALRRLETFSSEVGSTNSEHLKSIILGSGIYFFPVNALSKQKRAMRRGMSKSCILNVRCYTACMIDINEYLAVFPGAKASEKNVRRS